MIRGFLLVAAMLHGPAAPAGVVVQADPDTGLRTWTAEWPGFSIQFIQLLPDFVRAVFGSHGFPPEQIEAIAGQCVFGTVARNTSARRLSYRVADWRFTGEDGVTRPVKTKSQWLAQWRRAGISFSWTLLPDDVVFEQGDWQQGFTTIGLAPGSRFDLKVVWTLGGEPHAGILEDMHCAPAHPVRP